MLIFIPSAGRADRVTTLDSLPARRARNDTTLVVPEAEVAAYREHWPAIRIVGLSDAHRGIRATRQWIMDSAPFGARIVMMDDDMRFRQRQADGRFLRVGVADGLIEAIDAAMWNGFAHVGLSDEFMCHTQPRGRREEARYNDVLAYDLAQIERTGPRPQYRVEVGEEHDVHLQLSARGLRSCVVTEWTKSGKRYSAGGCSTWRTAEVERAGLLRLAELHPALVTTAPNKDTVSGLSLRIRWSKALRPAGTP